MFMRDVKVMPAARKTKRRTGSNSSIFFSSCQCPTPAHHPPRFFEYAYPASAFRPEPVVNRRMCRNVPSERMACATSVARESLDQWW
jgi:hypothetical protein